MSYPKHNRRDGFQHSRSGSTIQKKREIEKRRREQQSTKQEAAVDVPVFSQPVKITTTRQDSLTRNIKNILGDRTSWWESTTVGQGPNASSAMQEVSNAGNETSIVALRRTGQSHSSVADDSDSRMSTGHLVKSRKEEFSNSFASQQKQLTHTAHSNSRQSHTSAKADVEKLPSKLSNAQVSPRPQQGSDQGHRFQIPFNDSEEPIHSAIIASERDRISSVDSDVGVENILKEMVELPPSLTAIKTPIVNDNKFNFTNTLRKKLDGPESSLESSNTDALDGGAVSDGESSCDSSDDDTNENWNLGSLMEQTQPSNSSHSSEKSTSSNSLNVRNRSMDKLEERNDFSKSVSANNPSRHNSQFKTGRTDQSKEKVSNVETSDSPDGFISKGAHRYKPGSERHLPDEEKSKSYQKRQSGQSRESNEASEQKRKIHTHVLTSSHSALTNQSFDKNSPASAVHPAEHGLHFQSYKRKSGSGDLPQKKAKMKHDKTRLSWPEKSEKTSHRQRNPSLSNDCALGENPNDFNGKPHAQGSSHVKTSSGRSYPREELHHGKSDISVGKYENEHIKPENFSHKALWVRFKPSLLSAPTSPSDFSRVHHETIQHGQDRETSSHRERSKTPRQQKKILKTVSTGSETEQPVRRANCVQVAAADGSTDWTDYGSKRKHEFPGPARDSTYCKRQRKDSPYEDEVAKANDSSLRSETHSLQNQPLTRDAGGMDLANSGYCCQPSGVYESVIDSVGSEHTPNSVARQASPNSSNLSTTAATVVLPDSSVPGEQERIQTSDWYMREGKKKKHESDGMVNSRTGRTRPGEALSRALSYFEASLFFIMSGYVMESENPEERSEPGSNSSSSTSHCPMNMYQQTIPFLDFVLKMRPRVEQDDKIYKRIAISCLRCQAFIYFRIFKLKKDVAVKYSELLTEQFKVLDKTNRIPSPWHNANAAPNVLSPLSPPVPSPVAHRGPSPASSNGEQVSSSTQTGKMTPPTHSAYSFSQKTYDLYRHHHAIMRNLLQAHEKWDQSESMLEEHIDFFRNIDNLSNLTLTFHSTLQDVFLYYKMVLRQLRSLMTNSPLT